MLSISSRKEELQGVVYSVFTLCLEHQIALEPKWVPRAAKEVADAISCVVGCDDLQLNPVVFQSIDSMWGPHTNDCFASETNAQLERFHSRFAEVNSEAVDSFTVNSQGDNNWWCPPLYLVPRVLRHAQVCKAMDVGGQTQQKMAK